MLLLKPFTVDPGRSMVHPRGDPTYVHFHFASKVCHLTTRIRVRLLGPCFKTGWLKPLCQHLQNAGPALHRIKLTLRTNTGVCSHRAESTMGRPLGAFLVPRSPTGHAPRAIRFPFRPPGLVPHSEPMLASATAWCRLKQAPALGSRHAG